MKTILLFVALGLTHLYSFAQINCASETFRNYCANHNHNKYSTAESDAILYNHIIEKKFRKGGTELTTLPVVVHIIHQNGAENISDESVELGIQQMNEAFANSGPYNTPDGVNTQIQFCLARQDENGNLSSGINRVNSQLTNHFVPSQSEELKDLIRWNTELYINIWVVAAITRDPDQTGVVGYATFPQSHGSNVDGLVVEATSFSSENFITVLVHEMGHYLGLYHTFQDGCPNNDCLMTGDRVCDTPPDNFLFDQSCNPNANSCSTDDDDESINNPFRPIGFGGLGDQTDLVTNYMDYTGINCFDSFTAGQSERMQVTIETIRASLLNSVACYPPCDNPMTIDAIASDDTMLSGETITFTDISTGNTSREWRVNNIVVTNNATFNFSETEQGIYSVELYIFNDQQGCTISLEFNIEVICPVTSSFNTTNEYIAPGQNAVFVNTSEGAISYTWYVDNQAVSSDEDLNYNFADEGLYFVQLQASGPNCSVLSESVLVTVGLCSSGKECNSWLLHPSGANAQGLNFNGISVEIINNDFTVYSEGKSTFSDAAGEIILTSNGDFVWDKNFDILPNGSDLMGHFSSRDGVLFVKAPDSENIVYIFTNDANENSFNNGLRYSAVDLSLNNGLGDIIPGQKNLFISASDNECLTAIKHCNGRDFWLLTKNNANNQIVSFLVDINGVGTAPVISPAGPASNGLYYTRDFAVSAESGMFFNDKTLYSFDNSNGESEILYVFNNDVVLLGEFSPNGRYLYLLIDLISSTGLLQIDLTLPVDDYEDEAYELVIGPGSPIAIDLQKAPDGKIYLPIIFGNNIARIENPNAPGELVEIDDSALSFTGLINSMGNYFHSYISGSEFAVVGPYETCANIDQTFGLSATCIEFPTNWELPDGGTILSEQENSISAIFDAPGIYRVVCSADLSCGHDSDTLFITVNEGLNVNLGPDMNICNNTNITLDAGAGGISYVWQDGSTLQTLEVSQPGIYSVEVFTEECFYSDEITISGPIDAIINLGPDDNLCNGEPILLYAGDDFLDYTWQDGSTGPFYQVYEGGTYTVSATTPCDASDSIFIDDCDQSINVEEESDSSLSFNLFPNPADKQLSIIGDFSGSQHQIDIFDARGRLIHTIRADLSPMIISTIQMQSGLYLLRITGLNRVSTFNFIVNH